MIEREISSGQVVLVYACWILAMVLGFLALVSGRELVLTILAVQQVDLKLVGLADKVVFFFMGVVGLVIIVLSEGYFRNGVKRSSLTGRIGLVFGLELVVLFLFDVGRLLVPDVAAAARPDVLQTLMSLLVGSLCLFLFWKRRVG